MSDQRAFDHQPLQEAPLLMNPGLLDQLGLPPKVIRYLRENQRRAWIVTGCLAALIAAVSLFNSYTSHREVKAANALTEAMKAEAVQKGELLQKVADDYGSTDAGLWARIEIAQEAEGKGEIDKAIAGLQGVRKSLGKDNPMMPLLLFKLAGLHENNNALDNALVLYAELAGFKGFARRAYEAQGRIYEAQGKKEEAVAIYQKYLAEGEAAAMPALAGASADPEQERIKARISALQDK